MVLATSTPLTIGIPALFKKWFYHTPFIFEARDVWPEAVISIGAITNPFSVKILYFLEKLIYDNASEIVVLSKDMKKSIVSRFPMKRDSVTVIENISEITRFKKFPHKSSFLESKLGFKPHFSVLYAGTFGLVNGLEYVINLAEMTLKVDRKVIFILIGDGGQKKSLKDYARLKGVLDKNLFILDPVPKNDLPKLYSEIDLGSSFVIPIKELWSNSANKFFDTLAASKPILINHGGWQKEEIIKNDLGYVLPEKIDVHTLDAFLRYTKNANLLSSQSKNAFHIASTKYSLPVAINKYLYVISKVDESIKGKIIVRKGLENQTQTSQVKGISVIRPEPVKKFKKPTCLVNKFL